MSANVTTARCKTCGALAKAWFFPNDPESNRQIKEEIDLDYFIVKKEEGPITGPTVRNSDCPECIMRKAEDAVEKA